MQVIERFIVGVVREITVAETKTLITWLATHHLTI